MATKMNTQANHIRALIERRRPNPFRILLDPTKSPHLMSFFSVPEVEERYKNLPQKAMVRYGHCPFDFDVPTSRFPGDFVPDNAMAKYGWYQYHFNLFTLRGSANFGLLMYSGWIVIFFYLKDLIKRSKEKNKKANDERQAELDAKRAKLQAELTERVRKEAAQKELGLA